MRIQLPAIILLCINGIAVADYRDDIGYTRLLDELGANTPDGSGVPVTQAEALSGDPPAYMPNRADGQFSSKIITDKSGTNPSGSYSGHATSVGRSFYGNTTSIAPAISVVNAYDANSWLQSDFLRFNDFLNRKPLATSDRVANHSWIGSYGDPAADSDTVRRTDWVVETDEFIQCVGVKNNSSANQSLLSGAYNVIVVGKSDGVNGFGTSQLDNDYLSGRTRPEIVAPMSSSSGATPVVSAAAALLVELGHNNTGLSADPLVNFTVNRNGDTIFNAERSEVIKAALMAGADRATGNSSSADITDYRADPANQTVNGLDKRFGAGQINIYNSFHIVTAGEQNSDEDDGSGGGVIGSSGFDYDPSFGGTGGSNTTASYNFSTGANSVGLSATLAWNIDIEGGDGFSFSGGATRHNLDLYLYDVTGGDQVMVHGSASTVDNTETIQAVLDAGKDYLLQVARQGSFDRDFAIAWYLTDLVDTDSDGTPDLFDTDDDNDGLSDTDEATYQTEPLVADTDGDGFDDGMEVSYGSNPLLDSDTPAGNYNNNGDINNDGTVNAADVLLATRMVLGELVPTVAQHVRADIVPDGEINAGDLLRIQQLALAL